MLVAETSDLFLWKKFQKWFSAAFFFTYIRISFGHCHVICPYKEILSSLRHCHLTFPYMEPVSFSGTFAQKVKVSCFSDSLVKKTAQQKGASAEGSLRTRGKMVAVMLQVIPSFYTNYSKNRLLITANTYEKFIVSKEYCIACHDGKMCFLPNCRYHIILIGNIKDLLQKLDAFCFNYQHVDCLYTFLCTASMAKLLSRVHNSLLICRGQFISTSKTEEWTECPASRKRDSWGKSTKNIRWAPSERPNRRKLLNQCLQTELNKLKRLNLK